MSPKNAPARLGQGGHGTTALTERQPEHLQFSSVPSAGVPCPVACITTPCPWSCPITLHDALVELLLAVPA